MSLTVNLSPATEARLAEKAKALGIDSPTYAERVLEAEVSLQSLDEILKPVRDAFGASGMSEGELSDMLVQAKKAMHAERHAMRPE